MYSTSQIPRMSKYKFLFTKQRENPHALGTHLFASQFPGSNIKMTFSVNFQCNEVSVFICCFHMWMPNEKWRHGKITSGIKTCVVCKMTLYLLMAGETKRAENTGSVLSFFTLSASLSSPACGRTYKVGLIWQALNYKRHEAVIVRRQFPSCLFAVLAGVGLPVSCSFRPHRPLVGKDMTAALDFFQYRLSILSSRTI